MFDSLKPFSCIEGVFSWLAHFGIVGTFSFMLIIEQVEAVLK